MSDVFISYSRQDTAFVRKLHASLTAQGRDIWVDWEDIPPTAEWLAEIQAAIEAAHTLVFVLSPDSVQSQVCAAEIEHAAQHNKRLVPVVCRDVVPASVPNALARLNWLFFRPTDDFDAAFKTLITALDTDLVWVQTHTRLTVRAVEWYDSVVEHRDTRTDRSALHRTYPGRVECDLRPRRAYSRFRQQR